jgi:hypothetical protein
VITTATGAVSAPITSARNRTGWRSPLTASTST